MPITKYVKKKSRNVVQIGDWLGHVAWWYMSCDASRVHLALLTLTSRWQTSLWILYCNPQISIVERHSIMAPDWLMNCRLACYDSLIVLASFTVSAQLHITSVPRKLWITQGCTLNGERKMTLLWWRILWKRCCKKMKFHDVNGLCNLCQCIIKWHFIRLLMCWSTIISEFCQCVKYIL